MPRNRRGNIQRSLTEMMHRQDRRRARASGGRCLDGPLHLVVYNDEFTPRLAKALDDADLPDQVSKHAIAGDTDDQPRSTGFNVYGTTPQSSHQFQRIRLTKNLVMHARSVVHVQGDGATDAERSRVRQACMGGSITSHVCFPRIYTPRTTVPPPRGSARDGEQLRTPCVIVCSGTLSVHETAQFIAWLKDKLP